MDSTKQEELKKFVSNNVFACQSMLVGELLKTEFFQYDDIVNLYKTRQMLKDEGYKTDEEIDRARDDGAGDQEIYEWWVVDSWLLDKLEAAGEPVLRTDFGDWWGRTCTGQAILLDGVIVKIYDGLKA